MHGLVLIGSDGEPLRPSMICSDFRAHEELAHIEQVLTPDRVLRTTGSPGLSMFTGPKVLWVKNHEPHTYERISKLLLPKDYVGLVMAGEPVTDPSDASGTMLYDCERDHWDEALCAASAVLPDWLPAVEPATAIRGGVREAFAEVSGIPAGTPVIVGGGDLPTTVIGTGVVAESDVGISLGTAGIVFRLAHRIDANLLGKIFYFRHALTDLLVSMGSCPATGFSVRWFEEQVLGISPDYSSQEGDIEPRILHKEPSLFFLPFLLGTGSPYMDYKARGAFLGLSHHHGEAEMRQAILEGISYSLQQSYELLQFDRPPVERILVCAGGSHDLEWLNILASILGRSLITLEQKDTAVLGGAILASHAAGWFDTIEEGINRFVKVERVVMPTTENVELYDRAYSTYLKLCDMVETLRRDGLWE
jgi:xylulokinase